MPNPRSRSREGPALRLSKWYADAVAPDGTLAIAYHVEMAWRGARLRLGSLLLAAPLAPPETLLTACPGRAPSWSAEGLAWPASRLGGAGSWKPLAPCFSRTLLSRGGRTLEWTCLAPAARARIERTAGEAPLEGLGYAERIDMTFAPWRLPIRELRWGRFVSEEASLVFLDWRGEHPLRLVLHGGGVAPAAAVDEGRVETADATLMLGEPRTLREGVVGPALLSRLPLLSESLPARLLALEETKWLCRGLLTDAAGRHEGWVIHEVVRWP